MLFDDGLLDVPDDVVMFLLGNTQAIELMVDIERVFSLSWLTLLPPLVVIISIVCRIAPVIAMALSSTVAAILGVALQGFSMSDSLRAMVAGFDISNIMTFCWFAKP